MMNQAQHEKYRELLKKGYNPKTAYILAQDNPLAAYEKIEKFKEYIRETLKNRNKD